MGDCDSPELVFNQAEAVAKMKLKAVIAATEFTGRELASAASARPYRTRSKSVGREQGFQDRETFPQFRDCVHRRT